MRGRGMAFMLGRATARNNVSEPQTEHPQTSELEELSDLHDKGVLTDEEFSVAKKKVLSGK